MATRFYSSVEYGASRSSTDPDILYFNATINNNGTDDPQAGEVDPQVTASFQRQYPLLQDASDYMVSAVRLSTNGATRNLPLLIPQVQTSSVGTQWLADIRGTTMTITSQGQPYIYPGLAIGGSGNALLVSGSSVVASQEISISLGANGQPLTIVAAPTPPNGQNWTLSSTIPDAFFPGSPTHPAGYYQVASVSNANLFVGQTQADRDLTVYSFTIENNTTGALSQVFVEWITQEPAAQKPSIPVIVQNLGSEYYYCYSYDWWVSLCNTALAGAWAGAGSPGTAAPVLYYFSNSTASLQFYISPDPADSISPTPDSTYRLYMNSNMANLFPNFPGQWLNKSGGRTFEVYHSTNYIGVPGLPADGNHDAVQEYPGTTGWSPVDALIVTTSQIPIVAEQTTPPSLVGVSDTGFNRGVSEAAFQPILLDVTRRELTGTEDWRSNFVYEATGEYRMISLTTQSTPISSVDLQAWWRNRLDDALYPLRLSNGSSLSVKLMFRRKQMGV